MQYSLDQLRAMPTIRSGPVNDLKIDTGWVRVWVRRGGGVPAILVFVCNGGRWDKVGAFNEQLSVPCQRLLDQ